MIPPAPAEQVKTDPDTGITIVVGSFPSDMTPEEVADAAYRTGFVHWFHQGEIRSAQRRRGPHPRPARVTRRHRRRRPPEAIYLKAHPSVGCD